MVLKGRHPGGVAALAVACFLASLLLASVTASAAARPGRLEKGFGKHGRLRSLSTPNAFWGLINGASGAAPDGSFYTTLQSSSTNGELPPPELDAYRAGGAVDRGFGGGAVAVEVPGRQFWMEDFAVDREGRPLVVGKAWTPTPPPPPTPYTPASVTPGPAVVIRYDRQGQPDPSFGDGNGIVAQDFGLTASSPGEEPGVEARQVAVDSQGRIVLVIGQQEVVPGERSSVVVVRDKLLVRLTPTGQLDPSFGGGDGTVPLPAGDEIEQLAIGPRDEVFLAATRDRPQRSVLLKLTSAGRPEPRFPRHGVSPPGGGDTAIAVDSRGRLLALDRANPHRYRSADIVSRYLPSGRPDRGFGDRGQLSLTLPGWSYLQGIAVDPGGGVYLTGTFFLRSPGQTWKQARRAFVVLHRLSSGKADPRFGHGGRVVTGFGHWFDAGAVSAALVPRRGLLVTGFAKRRTDGYAPSTMVLAKYRTPGP